MRTQYSGLFLANAILLLAHEILFSANEVANYFLSMASGSLRYFVIRADFFLLKEKDVENSSTL